MIIMSGVLHTSHEYSESRPLFVVYIYSHLFEITWHIESVYENGHMLLFAMASINSERCWDLPRMDETLREPLRVFYRRK